MGNHTPSITVQEGDKRRNLFVLALGWGVLPIHRIKAPKCLFTSLQDF